jgi:hypothetical protein
MCCRESIRYLCGVYIGEGGRGGFWKGNFEREILRGNFELEILGGIFWE